MKSIRKIELKWKRISMIRDEDSIYSSRITCSVEAVRVASALIANDVHEVLIALHLNNKSKIVGYHEISRGGLNGSSVTPADVFRPVLLSGANKVILAHNHPSGESEPSTEDIVITKRIKEAGDILGVKVLDHIIVGDCNHYSFLDNGIL